MHTYMLFAWATGRVQFYGPYDSDNIEFIVSERKRLNALLRPATITEIEFQGSQVVGFGEKLEERNSWSG